MKTKITKDTPYTATNFVNLLIYLYDSTEVDSFALSAWILLTNYTSRTSHGLQVLAVNIRT